MPLSGSVSENADKTKNYSITGVKENDSNTISASAFVKGYRDTPDPRKLNAPQYGVVGGTLAVESGGNSMGIATQHIPNFGNKITASSSVNLLNTDKHKFDAHAFASQTIPKEHKNFSTYGGGVDYSLMNYCTEMQLLKTNTKYSKTERNKVGASASVAHTPMFNKTDYNVGGHVNLHKTPTSSLDLNMGASKTSSPFSNGRWQQEGSLILKKKF